MEDFKTTMDKIEQELSFSQQILSAAPAILYINELQTPNDYQSGRNVWMNQRGLDFVGYTQEEITAKGYSFFDEFIHPEDREVLPESIKTAYASPTETILGGMYRAKGKNQTAYRWLYGNYTVLRRFEDGSVQQMLVVALDISDKMQCQNQLVEALSEINLLKHKLQVCNCSHREKEVLELIIKGKTDKEIAKALAISITTAKKHRTHLLHKNGVKNTAELVALTL